MERGWDKTKITGALLLVGLLLGIAKLNFGPARAEPNTLYLCSAWESVSPEFLEDALSGQLDRDVLPFEVLTFEVTRLANDAGELHLLLLDEDVLDNPPNCLSEGGRIPDVLLTELQDAADRFSRPTYEHLGLPHLPQGVSQFSGFNMTSAEDRILIFLSRIPEEFTVESLQSEINTGRFLVSLIEQQWRGSAND